MSSHHVLRQFNFIEGLKPGIHLRFLVHSFTFSSETFHWITSLTYVSYTAKWVIKVK